MKFSNLKVGTRLTIGFAALIAIMLVVAALGSRNNSRQSEMMLHALDVDVAHAVAILRLRTQLANMRGYEKDMALNAARPAKAREYLESWRAARRRADEHLQTALALAAGETERGGLKQLQERLSKYENSLEAVHASIELGGGTTPVEQVYGQLGALRDVTHETETITQGLFESAMKDIDAVKPALAAGQKQRQTFVLGGLIVVVALAALIGLLIVRSITGPVAEAVRVAEALAQGDLTQNVEARSKDEIGRLMNALKGTVMQLASIVGRIKATSDTVGTASREIVQGNTDLSTRTEEQASALEQTSASMQQMTATVGQNAQNAKKVNELAAQASGVAAKGGEVVKEAVSTMNGITASSKKIADIIGVIDAIAFQTNILALNAAVEAARAGEQGRGFAVVAAEVRSLAQRSAAAAKEIKDLITDSVAEVDAGSQQVNDTGRAMEQIVASVKKVTDLISEITAASQEQAQGIEQVSETMVQLEKVTQQNAAMVEEASAAAGSLEQQSRALASAVAVFRLNESPVEAKEHLEVKTPDVNALAANTAAAKKGNGHAAAGWHEF